MSHGRHNHHVDPSAGDVRLAYAVGVNLVLTLVQIVGGILSGSLALIADAPHNPSDAIALIIAIVARRIGRRPASAEMTFGYGRAEVVAALTNYTTLIVLGLDLVVEAVMRPFTPEPVAGRPAVIIAAITDGLRQPRPSARQRRDRATPWRAAGCRAPSAWWRRWCRRRGAPAGPARRRTG